MFHETRLLNLKLCFSSERPSSSSPFPYQNRVLSLQEISFTVVYWNDFKMIFQTSHFAGRIFQEKSSHYNGFDIIEPTHQNFWLILGEHLFKGLGSWINADEMF